ncbi:MFS transporter [Paractinoplanes ferrugineus]|uniref:MFS transporter n=1 Tax=Paractinoplanes ferrugineus TaxID=113564 RepID=A0A919IXJ9_9ACTN|nr:MFS transporter [Actinoplanes ferrugineus]GIE10705.1 MFS transporter [Actinoplanes ferrugineus]
MRRLIRQLAPPAGVVRVLALGNLIRTVGTGVVMSMSVLYFVGPVGLPVHTVGLGMSCAAVLAMMASVPAGHLADVLGARRAAQFFVIAQGLAVGTYLVVDSGAAFFAAAALTAVADAGSSAARGALVAASVPTAERVRARAYLRTATNLGVSLGAGAGALALAVDTRGGYLTALAFAGLCFLASAVTTTFVPAVATVRAAAGTRHSVLHVFTDRRFLAVAALNVVLATNAGLLTVALPLWISAHTEAPTALYPLLLLVNTVLVVLLQLRFARLANDARQGARALRWASTALAVCCLVFAAAGALPGRLAVLVLVIGTVVHVVGELLHSTGAWAVSYDLAPPHAQGQYQGLFGMTSQIAGALVPLGASLLIVDWGWPGWLVFALALLAAGLAMPLAVRIRPAPDRALPAVS